jgi:hypothetical protein
MIIDILTIAVLLAAGSTCFCVARHVSNALGGRTDIARVQAAYVLLALASGLAFSTLFVSLMGVLFHGV